VIKDPKQAFEEIERLGLLDAVMTRCFDLYSVDVVGGRIEKASCDRYRVRHGEKAPWTMWTQWELFEYSCRNGLLTDANGVVDGLGELLDLLWDLGYSKEKVATAEAEMARLAFEASKDGRNAREIEGMVEERRARFARPLAVSGSGPIMAGGIPDSSNLTGSLGLTDSPSQESICGSEPVGGGVARRVWIGGNPSQRPLGSGWFGKMIQGGAPDDLTAAMEIVEKNREKWKVDGQSSDENEGFEVDPEQVIWRKRDICYGPCRWKDFSAASLVGVYCWSLDRKDTRLYQVVGLETTLVVLRTKNVCFSLEHEDFFKKFCLIQPPYDSKELAAIAEFPIVEEEAGQSSDENDRSDRSDMTDTTGEKGLDFGFELPSWPVMCRALSVVKQSTVAMAKNSGLSCEFCAHLKYWLRHMTGSRTGRELLKFSVGDLRDIVKAGLYDRRELAEVSESIVSDIADMGKPKVEVVGRPAAEVVTVDPEKVAVVEKKIALPTLGEPTQYQFAGVSLADKVRVFKKGGVPLLLRPSVVDQFKKMLADHPLLGDAEWCRRRLTIWPNGYKLTMFEGSN